MKPLSLVSNQTSERKKKEMNMKSQISIQFCRIQNVTPDNPCTYIE